MTVFPALSYTSTREIPTLLYTSSVKKVPLSGGAYPYSPLLRVSAPPPPHPGFCYFSLNLLDSVSSVQPVVTSGHSTRPRVTILRFMLYFCSKLIFGCLFNLIYLFTWYLFMLTYIVWRKCLGLHKNFMSLRSGSVKGHHQQIDIYWKGVHDCNFYIFCAWKQQST